MVYTFDDTVRAQARLPSGIKWAPKMDSQAVVVGTSSTNFVSLLECSPASLHCRIYGKALVHHSFFVSGDKSLTCSFRPKLAGQRANRLLHLYVSTACKEKHTRMSAELSEFCLWAGVAKNKSLVSQPLAMRLGGASTIIDTVRIESISLLHLRWVVTPKELPSCSAALSAAFNLSPLKVSTMVMTMSGFIKELGNVEQ